MNRLNELAAFLKAHDDYAVLGHINPDGDTSGSCIALCLALHALGKRAFVFLPGGLAKMYGCFDPAYMSDIQWHFIGHLQTNKLKMVLPYVSLIQSVDSERLLSAIDSWGAANDKVLDVLLEPHVAAEETKQGFSPDEITHLMAEAGKYGNIRFKGIMGMATFTDDEDVIRNDFASLRAIFDSVRSDYPSLSGSFTEFSIGMSDDYPIAVGYGSTMVRIGSMIFGARNY